MLHATNDMDQRIQEPPNRDRTYQTIRSLYQRAYSFPPFTSALPALLHLRHLRAVLASISWCDVSCVAVFLEREHINHTVLDPHRTSPIGLGSIGVGSRVEGLPSVHDDSHRIDRNPLGVGTREYLSPEDRGCVCRIGRALSCQDSELECTESRMSSELTWPWTLCLRRRC